MRRLLISLCVAFFLVGFSSTANAKSQRGLPTLDVPEGKSAVYIYRDRKLVGAAVKHRIFLNKAAVLPIGNGVCTGAIVESGKVRVAMESKLAPFTYLLVAIERVFTEAFEVLTLEVEPGKSYYLKFELNKADTLAPTRLAHSLFLVSEAESLKSASKCKFKDPTYIPDRTAAQEGPESP